MSMVILNGSPKKKMTESNTEAFARSFINGMKNPCEIKYISSVAPETLLEQIRDFDTVIVMFPLYVHAMPGIVMRFFEAMQSVAGENKSLGFIIQAGFPESSQERFVLPYLEQLAATLGYSYLGAVVKGDAAVVAMYPAGFAKLLVQIETLGKIFEETHAFDAEIKEKLAQPHSLSKFQIAALGFACKLGISNIFWNKMLKQNGAYRKRLDRPYL